jgi:hypothetical protein
MAKIANVDVRVEEQTVVINFIDGNVIGCSLDDLPKEMLLRAALHGLQDKLRDSYSGAVSVEEAYGKCLAVKQSIESGAWRQGGRGDGIWVDALILVSGREAGECREVWSGLSEEQRKAVKKNAAMQAAYHAIKAERSANAKGSTDVGELFNS